MKDLAILIEEDFYPTFISQPYAAVSCITAWEPKAWPSGVITWFYTQDPHDLIPLHLWLDLVAGRLRETWPRRRMICQPPGNASTAQHDRKTQKCQNNVS